MHIYKRLFQSKKWFSSNGKVINHYNRDDIDQHQS